MEGGLPAVPRIQERDVQFLEALNIAGDQCQSVDLRRGGEEGFQGPEIQACFLAPGHDDSPGLGDVAVDVEDAPFESRGELTRQPGGQAVAALAGSISSTPWRISASEATLRKT